MKLKCLGSGSKGNCYLLQDKDETLIVEAGIKYKNILKGLNFNISNVVGCLITHEHKDHSKAIYDISKNGINIYASKGTFNTCEVIKHRRNDIKSQEQFKIGEFTILPFAAEHDAAEPLGFLIQHKKIGKLLFITDSYFCRYKFKGLHHILIECNYSTEIMEKNIDPGLAKRLIKSHFSLENVKKFLQQTDLSNCKDITLIHLSDSNSNAEQFKNDIEKLTGVETYIAEPGLEVEL